MEASDGGDGEDVALLLSIKDAEISTLRQQMAQLTGDLKRQLSALSAKDEDALKLRHTVDGLRALLAEKDETSTQHQARLQELEALRMNEAEQRAVLQAALSSAQSEHEARRQDAQRQLDSELAASAQRLREAEDQWSVQLMAARQMALDESIHRSTQQQAALERAADAEARLQQQLEGATAALSVKDAELEAARRQLGAALEANRKLEASHGRALAAKEDLIGQLQRQLDAQASGMGRASGEHEKNVAKLITSLHQMQESCQAQTLEVQEYATAQKRLQDERRVLREHLREQEAALAKLTTEKGVLESALQHEVMAQAAAQAQLNIFQARLTEAVVELERRCAGAEGRSSQLMAQLVEERGRLVDAVIEQANSSTPQLAAELAKSLESDRLHTQAELQMAQERARSLAEELGLIRSTLLPLLAAPGSSAAAAVGLAPLLGAAPQEPGNGSLAALAHAMEKEQQAAMQVAAAAAHAGEEQAPTQLPAGGVQHLPTCGVFRSPVAKGPPKVAATASPPADGSSSAQPRGTTACTAAASPAAQMTATDARAAAQQGARGSARSGGSLAGLVCELQADVSKLQQQLHSSQRQVRWDAGGQPGSPSRVASAEAHQVGAPAADAGSGCTCSAAQAGATPGPRGDLRGGVSTPSGSPGAGGPGSEVVQLHDALRYLMQRTEQLSAENGALKSHLRLSPPRAGTEGRGARQHESARALSQQPCGSPGHGSSGGGPLQHRTTAGACSGGLRHRHGRTVTEANAWPEDAGSDGASSLAGASEDALSIAASDELAVAEAAAAAAVNCARRRRDARAAAAAASGPRGGCRTQSPSSKQPGGCHRALLRSSSLDSGGTVSQDSTCSGLESTLSADAGRGAAASMSPLGSSRQLLEEVLASWPANSSLSKVVKQIIAGGSGSHNTGRRMGAIGHGPSAHEQLLRLAATASPSRRRLLKALADA